MSVTLSNRFALARELNELASTLTDVEHRTEAVIRRNEQLTELIKHPHGRMLVMRDGDLRDAVLGSEALSRLFIKRTDDEDLDSLKPLRFKGKADRDLRRRLSTGPLTPPRAVSFRAAPAS